MIPKAQFETETQAHSEVSYKCRKDGRGPEIAVGGLFFYPQTMMILCKRKHCHVLAWRHEGGYAMIFDLDCLVLSMLDTGNHRFINNVTEFFIFISHLTVTAYQQRITSEYHKIQLQNTAGSNTAYSAVKSLHTLLFRGI